MIEICIQDSQMKRNQSSRIFNNTQIVLENNKSFLN